MVQETVVGGTLYVGLTSHGIDTTTGDSDVALAGVAALRKSGHSEYRRCAG